DEVAAARLISEITDIANDVRNNNLLIASYTDISPKASGAVAKTLQTQQAQIKGKAATDVWSAAKDAGGKTPAISNAAARITKLSADIKKIEADKAGLVKKRGEAETDASTLMSQSKRKQGKDALELFKQSSDKSKESADLANKIAQDDYQLMKLKQ